MITDPMWGKFTGRDPWQWMVLACWTGIVWAIADVWLLWGAA